MGQGGGISPESIAAGFRERGVVCTGQLSTTLYLAETVQEPLLLEGPTVEVSGLAARGVVELLRRLR